MLAAVLMKSSPLVVSGKWITARVDGCVPEEVAL